MYIICIANETLINNDEWKHCHLLTAPMWKLPLSDGFNVETLQFSDGFNLETLPLSDGFNLETLPVSDGFKLETLPVSQHHVVPGF